MLGLRINDIYLDLPPDALLSLELNSPLFFGTEAELLPGSYSFPFKIPLTARNRAAVGYPDLLQNARDWSGKMEAVILADGSALFVGEARIKDAEPGFANLYVVVNTLGALKDRKLNELDFGGNIILGTDISSVKAQALETTIHPLEAEYIFFPFWNSGFREKDSPTINGSPDEVQNLYYPDIGVFSDGIGQDVMPFLRLSFLLEKLFSTFGFALDNRFQTEPELQRLVVWNNHNIADPETGQWPLSFHPANHVSATTAGDFLKRLCRLFCLAPLVDSIQKTVELRPLRDLANQLARHDWTSRAEAAFTVAPATASRVARYGYKPVTGEFYPNSFQHIDYFQPAESIVFQTIEDVAPLDEFSGAGYYYERSTDRLIYWHPNPGNPPPVEEFITRFWRVNRVVPGEPVYESEIGSFFCERYGQIVGEQYLLPTANLSGNFWATGKTSAETPDRLIFYRKQVAIEPPGTPPEFLVPFASANVYDFHKNVIEVDGQEEQYSLHWPDERGLWNRWHRDWNEGIGRGGRELTIRLRLSARELRAFRFSEKVRLGGMDFWVKKLRFSISSRVSMVEATLFSVL